MAKRKRPSKYQQELRNARRRIKRLQERGYIINEYVPSGTSLQQLKKEYSLEALYERARYVTESGRVLTGTEARKYLRSRSARRGWETRRGRTEAPPVTPDETEFVPYEETIFRNMYEIIGLAEAWTPNPDWTPEVVDIKRQQKDALLDLLESFEITTEAKLQAAERIQENATEVNEIATRIMYATYRPNQVYSQKYDFYNFDEDYHRLSSILGASGIVPMKL